MVAKTKRPSIPMWVLVPVAFGADWIKYGLILFGHENRQWSHSLISVGVCATIAAVAYFVATRSGSAALVIWLTYASHWPADFITGTKPTWPGGPNVGLMLYAHPLGDVVVESALIVASYLIYRRSLPPESRRRAIAFLVPLGLIGMHIAFAAVQAPDFG